MAKRNVVWTRTADVQYGGILEYWVKRNATTNYSLMLLKLVAERTAQIAETPLLFKPTNFKDIRVASLGNFSIFFKYSDVEIIILAFWDNRQDPKRLLDVLKKRK